MKLLITLLIIVTLQGCNFVHGAKLASVQNYDTIVVGHTDQHELLERFGIPTRRAHDNMTIMSEVWNYQLGTMENLPSNVKGVYIYHRQNHFTTGYTSKVHYDITAFMVDENGIVIDKRHKRVVK